MAGTYKISATPLLYSQGEYKGKLKGISFTAVSSTQSREWFAQNCGQFEMALTRMMPGSLARIMLAALKRGDDVEFPGLYQEPDFDHGFFFEWTPVHFVAPPIFAEEAYF